MESQVHISRELEGELGYRHLDTGSRHLRQCLNPLCHDIFKSLPRSQSLLAAEKRHSPGEGCSQTGGGRQNPQHPWRTTLKNPQGGQGQAKPEVFTEGFIVEARGAWQNKESHSTNRRLLILTSLQTRGRGPEKRAIIQQVHTNCFPHPAQLISCPLENSTGSKGVWHISLKTASGGRHCGAAS